MQERGYHVEMDYQASLDEIEGYVSDANIHGFFFVGHGVEGLLQTHGDELVLTSGAMKMHQHHKLGFVTLMACEAGRDAGWHDTVSRYGTLRMYSGNLHPAFCSWDDIPIVEDEGGDE